MGHTKQGKAYTYPASKFEAPWVKAVADETRVVMRHQQTPDPPYHVAMKLRIARGPKSVHPWPTQHDVDKLARAVIDGLVKGKAMVDDRHVVSLSIAKDYAEDGEREGVIAHVLPVSVRI